MPGTGFSDRPHVRTTRAVSAASKQVEDHMHRDTNGTASDDKLEILAKIVDSRLAVWCDGGIVAFSVNWTDPQTAYDLVSAAIHNFLEARNATEVSIILDAIDLLEEHAQSEREGIDTAMVDFIRLKDGWKTADPPLPPAMGMVNRPRIGAAA